MGGTYSFENADELRELWKLEDENKEGYEMAGYGSQDDNDIYGIDDTYGLTEEDATRFSNLQMQQAYKDAVLGGQMTHDQFQAIWEETVRAGGNVNSLIARVSQVADLTVDRKSKLEEDAILTNPNTSTKQLREILKKRGINA